MFIREIIPGKEIRVALPLTAATGKIRVKRRSVLAEYGVPVATRREAFGLDCYVEWQIGYDAVVADSEKLKLTTLPEKRFVGANGREKALYELSEYLFLLREWKFLSRKEFSELAKKLKAIPREHLFDVHPDLAIKRCYPTEKTLNGVQFLSTRVEYPLVIHKFGPYEIVAEIITREKQRAVGVQPMLYFCVPVTELAANPPLVGRVAECKETADFIVNRSNARVFLELLHLFGMLSESHRRDVLSIISVILEK